MQIRPVHTHPHAHRAGKILLAALILALCALLIWIFATPSPVHGIVFTPLIYLVGL